MQDLGIPAGPVQKVSDIPLDPQLTSRDFFQTVRHKEPVFGYSGHPHMALPWRVNGFARPRLIEDDGEGADNPRVLKTWLGLGDDDISRLLELGALVPARPLSVENQFGGRLNTQGHADTEYANLLGLQEAGEGDCR